MKKYLIFIMTLLVVVSCAKEDVIVARAPKAESLGEFPQGETAADKKIVEIYEQFGVRCLYKGFTKEALEQSWSGGSTGKYGMVGKDIDDEKLLNFYVTFFADNIFKYLSPENTQGILPPSFYFVKDYYLNLANIYFGNSYFPNALEYYGKPQEQVFTGLGFWGFCFSIDEYIDISGAKKSLLLPSTSLEYSKLKEIILKNILDRMRIKGQFARPKFLDDKDLDYITVVKSAIKEVDDKNYYKRRGFPERLVAVATYSSSKDVYNTSSGIIKVNMTPDMLFIDYLWLGLRYTKAQIEINYKDFPLVLKYYNLVAEYMLSKYNLDLDGMAQVPAPIN